MTVKTFNLRTLLPSILLPLLVGAAAGLLSSGGFALYPEMNRPPLAPPSWVFPVVWTALYLLMGYAAYIIISSRSYDASAALYSYYVQLALNFLWPIVFFRFGKMTVAAVVLVLLIGAVVINFAQFYRIKPNAGYLLLPYLVWLVFALYLNIALIVLN